ncbi:type III-B CRISPR module RAMP protein Cmr6 [Paenibacillus faecalis]|uniref:type III-B CRISPR module RAMP protein Cmr6 n=1 Tax=Paenibacillus faecalis TaxID=2079532 RepID=UPI000D0E631F|nr:type III-B CRISPR module RAMP protein Cmr6 [Paenibacillus faecalis]
MKTSYNLVGTNAYLELTKLDGSYPQSDLLEVVTAEGDSKRKYYDELTEAYHKHWETEAIKWYCKRMEQYYSSVSEVQQEQFAIQCESPLVIGQGQPSVLETFLTIHRIYGVPYIPGTALKGVASHYCHKYVGKEDARFREGGDYYNVLFGAKDQAALIHYHDAFPTSDTVGTALRVDVMTPHHHGYNENTSTLQAPRDDDSPVPIHLLTVKADFQVFLTCDSEHEKDTQWLLLARDMIIAAVEQEGLGGKTNSGYGRFQQKESGHA